MAEDLRALAERYITDDKAPGMLARGYLKALADLDAKNQQVAAIDQFADELVKFMAPYMRDRLADWEAQIAALKAGMLSEDPHAT